MLIPVLLLTVMGCEKINELTQPAPKDVLISYLELSLKMNSDKAYEYVSSDDKKIKSLSEYKKGLSGSDSAFEKRIKDNISYKVLKVTKTENEAIADVEVTKPDLEEMLKDFMAKALSSVTERGAEYDLEAEIAQKYAGVDLPTTATTQEFKMRKENDGWKVFLDWKAEKEKKEKQEKDNKIRSLEVDALLLQSENMIKKSITKMNAELQKYDEILKLDENNKEAKTNREILLGKIELFNKYRYWDVSFSADPIDDSKTVVLSLTADSGKNKWGSLVTVIARCKQNSTDFYINWNSYLGTDADVLTRIGSNKAVTSRWSMSTNKKSTFHKKPISFLKEMQNSNKLVAQISPYNASPVTAIFDTSGLENAIVPLREACGW